MKFRVRYQNLVSDWVKFYAPTAIEFNNIVSKTNWELIEDYSTGKHHYILLRLEDKVNT